MIEITAGQMAAIAADLRTRLRPIILQRWFEFLREVGDEVGESGRNAILADIERLASEAPDLATADLLMLADLKLVAHADEVTRR